MPAALIAALFGALVGVRTAKKRGGNRLDLIHYGAIYAIAFGLAGFVGAVLTVRLAGG